ncbi:MAG: nuclear transport factor 2 family protein [Armatimonadetes bacterium]|nr:nuclear transport factor 2 family protein [Armatimonadota bacterium]
MKKKTGGILIVMAFLMALASVAFPASSQRKQVINALSNEYGRYIRAFAAKNMAPIQNQIVSNWTGRIHGTTMGRSDLLQLTADAMESTSHIEHMCIHIKKLSLKGNVATATVSDIASLVLNEDDGTPRKLASGTLRKDTWVRVNGDWKLRRSETLGTIPNPERCNLVRYQ